MPLFDRYIAVDWSAANTPKRGKDSIWIGELGPDGRAPSENPPTRHAAMASITHRLLAALRLDVRALIGEQTACRMQRLGIGCKKAGDRVLSQPVDMEAWM